MPSSITLLLTACTSYPPPLNPARGQTAAQQEADAKDCDHQVHSAARSLFVGAFTAWTTEERDKYVACNAGQGVYAGEVANADPPEGLR